MQHSNFCVTIILEDAGTPADIRQLRDLMRYHSKLTNFTTGEKNRMQNCLIVSNLKLDDVFSDVFGKASTNIIKHNYITSIFKNQLF